MSSMRDVSLTSWLATFAGAMVRPLMRHDSLPPFPARHNDMLHQPEALVQYYGSIEAYLEEQRRCAIYDLDRQLRERQIA